jgi:hypothetical protein
MAEAMMMETESIKKPASTATATFLFSTISFLRLCFGVITSTSTKMMISIAMPKNEYKMELVKACDIWIDLEFIYDSLDRPNSTAPDQNLLATASL